MDLPPVGQSSGPPATASAKTCPGQEKLDSPSPTVLQPSEDELKREPGGNGNTLGRRVSIKLNLSPQDKKKIDRLGVKHEEVAAILVGIKERKDQEAAKVGLEHLQSLPGKFKEELNLDGEKGSLQIKEEIDSDDEKGCLQVKGNVDSDDEKGFLQVKEEYKGDIDSSGTRWNNQRGMAPRNVASSLSPYCQVLTSPSWETSEAYHRARGPRLILHLKETFYKVHRNLILSKIPRLPLIYHDFDDEDEDEHTLDESLHDINLMMYWLYHEKLPPRVKIQRAGVLGGMTWDSYKLFKFATRLSAFELMKCIIRSC